ncbi:MAG: hypothetical protein SH859_09895 [Hyphomicrobium aestuarii]|nr:hypothetical protein [Hyphomicrobium aestuarii]
MARAAKAVPTWNDVKVELEQFDRAGLFRLVKDLHGVSGDNQAFLHARLGLGADPLVPFKKTISRWINPDVIKGQDVSVAKAKKAISDYQKAIGQPLGMAELSIFYCEEAVRLLSDCGIDDEGYFSAIVRMFERALIAVMKLTPSEQPGLVDRLDRVRTALSDSWGVKDAVNDLWLDLEPRKDLHPKD